MSEIKYIIISDFHIGAENSVLTNLKPNTYETDNSKPSPVMVELVKCIRELLNQVPQKKKPVLILNGDILELSMTTENQAGMAFQRFIELTMPENPDDQLFDPEFIFIPGNHDHNLWETSRFSHFEKGIDHLKPGAPIDPVLHVTNMIDPDHVDTHLLSKIIQSYPHLRDIGASVRAVYPCYALLHEDKEKCMVISHGHYIESIYSFMSTFDKMVFPDRELPTWLADLELENFAWIDFFFSVMGRSGQVGKDVSLAYDKMQDPKEVAEMISNFANSATAHVKNPIKRWIEKKVLMGILKLTAGKMASTVRGQDEILVPESVEGLKKYLEVFVRNQLLAELNNDMPSDISFVFGHTHKPFEQDMPFHGFDNQIHVYNSGGWVIDSLDAMPFHGGALLMVSDELDTVSLHMFKEGDFTPSFEVTGFHQHKDLNPLYRMLKKKVDLESKAFQDFEKVAREQVQLRYLYLSEIIKTD